MELTELTKLQLSAPSAEGDVAAAELALQAKLPPDYRAFLLAHDGAEGWIGGHYLVLWRARELARFNLEYEVNIYAPGLLFFGGNGGGEGFAFDMRGGTRHVLQVPFIGMGDDAGSYVAASFTELLQRMQTTDDSLS